MGEVGDGAETGGGRAPYADVPAEELTLRDRLALDRTVLANERTFLAYLRTAFAFAAGGASLIHFIDRGWAIAAGWVMIPLGAGLLAWGVHRFVVERRRLAPLGRAVESARPARARPQRGGTP